jgi:hypothetical protein
MFNFKTGAMFGLDARIALAIFGALSVISGAALYSAIKEAKGTAFFQIFNEISKASESYWLDTGSKIDVNGSGYLMYTGKLIQNDGNVSGWKGPYLPYSYKDTVSVNIDLSIDISSFILYALANDDWSTTLADSPVRCNVATKGCYEWVFLTSNNADRAAAIDNLFDLLDSKYDGGDGASKGLIRKRESSATVHSFYFRGLLRGTQS